MSASSASLVVDRRLGRAPSAGGRGVGLLVMGLIGLHVPLAMVMGRVPAVSTAHALLTLAIGLVWAASGWRPERIALVAAYVTGAEVLWRMTGAAIYWEFGKYATILLFLVALLRSGRVKPPRAILLYLLLLLPAVFLTFAGSTSEVAREQTSYNLSGPLALMVSVWFCSGLRLSREGVARILTSLLAPIVGVAAIAAYSTVSGGAIQFGQGSNLQTSGGFGPNQVSAILGLGALVALILLALRVGNLLFRLGMFTVTLGLAAQSALTFSRSGLVIMVLCAFLGSLPLVKNPRALLGVGVVGGALIATAYYLVLPRLDELTEGALVERFEDRTLTGREELAKMDLLIFGANPFIGVGPGMAQPLRSRMGKGGRAHTEFTRMLAEHGLLGLASLCFLVATGWGALRTAKGPERKALVTVFLTFSGLFMLVSGMRLVAPAFTFGLATARLTERRTRQTAVRIRQAPPARPARGRAVRPLPAEEGSLVRP